MMLLLYPTEEPTVRRAQRGWEGADGAKEKGSRAGWQREERRGWQKATGDWRGRGEKGSEKERAEREAGRYQGKS